MMRALRRTDSGAAAIEYAIIGALIGIGLIGALVGTKTSLSAIFGVAATQMGSAGSDTSAGPSPLAAASPNWSAKTVASMTPGSTAYGAPTTTILFTDGSRAVVQKEFTKSNGSLVPQMINLRDANKPLNYIDVQSAYGTNNPYYVSTDTYSNGARKREYIVQLQPNGTATGNVYVYDSSGNLTSGTNVSAPNSNFTQAFNDGAYVASLAP